MNTLITPDLQAVQDYMANVHARKMAGLRRLCGKPETCEHNWVCEIKAEVGTKNIRIIVATGIDAVDKYQFSAHSFISMANGDIFKAAGYKVPAKHARGNIFKDAGSEALTPDGYVRYLK